MATSVIWGLTWYISSSSAWNPPAGRFCLSRLHGSKMNLHLISSARVAGHDYAHVRDEFGTFYLWKKGLRRKMLLRCFYLFNLVGDYLVGWKQKQWVIFDRWSFKGKSLIALHHSPVFSHGITIPFCVCEIRLSLLSSAAVHPSPLWIPSTIACSGADF